MLMINIGGSKGQSVMFKRECKVLGLKSFVEMVFKLQSTTAVSKRYKVRGCYTDYFVITLYCFERN